MQKLGPLILPPAHLHSIWNQISIGVAGGRPSRCALSACGKFLRNYAGAGISFSM